MEGDLELGNVDKLKVGEAHDSAEAASAKLWSVYIAQAEKYDKDLVESWRRNMEGILIFNRTAFEVAPPTPFIPSAASVVCNALWFIGLGLSLSCALIATLLEQWSREFLHRASMHSSPVHRARVFSYLYHGLRRFNMHVVVGGIPLLLHASLLFFFAGLVVFLVPINGTIMALSAAMLAVVTAVYSAFTILPLIFWDCPYHTPLSSAFWRLIQRFKISIPRLKLVSFSVGRKPTTSSADGPETVIATISRRALYSDDAQRDREHRALIWTVRALPDDIELQTFVDGIPDVLWGPVGRLRVYDDHIQKLVHNPCVRLHSRIEALLLGCGSGLLPIEVGTRREISCYKAIWALGGLSELRDDTKYPITTFKPSVFHKCLQRPSSSIDSYSISAVAMVRWSMFCGGHRHLTRYLNYLAKCAIQVERYDAPQVAAMTSYLRKLKWDVIFWVSNTQVPAYDPADVGPTSCFVQELIHEIDQFRTDAPYLILFDYLKAATRLDTLPYQFDQTCAAISLPVAPLSLVAKQELVFTIGDIVSSHIAALNSTNIHWVDDILATLISFWRRMRAIDLLIIEYFNQRNSDGALRPIGLEYGARLWSCIPATLSRGPAGPDISSRENEGTLADCLTAIWRLCILPYRQNISLSIYEAAFDSVQTVESCSVSVSLIYLLKARILSQIHLDDRTSLVGLLNKLFPRENSHSSTKPVEIQLDTSDNLELPLSELQIRLLADFSQSCTSAVKPYRAAKTLSVIGSVLPLAAIHASVGNQVHFSSSMRAMFQASDPDADLRQAAINARVFDAYTQQGKDHAASSTKLWIDDPATREIIQETLAEYTRTSAHTLTPSCLARVQALWQGFGAG